MKVFLTGASGFIGSRLIPELTGAGHQVIGLVRSKEKADALRGRGAEVLLGSLEDPGSLKNGASEADGVIHCAYSNDLSRMEEISKTEVQAITTLGEALHGSDRPLVITSVAAMGAAAPGQLAEEVYYNPNTPNPRKSTEIAGAAAAERGVHLSVVRLPQVHSPVKQGFVGQLLRIAREKGVSAYIGDGAQRWPAVHVDDTARLYRLVLERASAGAGTTRSTRKAFRFGRSLR